MTLMTLMTLMTRTSRMSRTSRTPMNHATPRATPLLAALLLLPALAPAQQMSVVNSPHNLSAGGPGSVRAASEDQVCIFCHAPHNASPIKPLWNRALPTEAYSIYTSRALDAEPGQPTGTSKMCLSCHDGTIALGALISRDTPIQMSGGVTTMPQGPSRLGTDLRDDHPISFRYDPALAAKDPHLKTPSSLPPQIKLDSNNELQCTACHDAHNNVYGDFLVMRNDNSELCTSCHAVGNTSVAAHSACIACHQPHTAPSGPYLLRAATIGDTCLRCHEGTHAGAENIRSDIGKAFNHETFSQTDPPGSAQEHTSCTSCHSPHTMSQGTSTAPNIHPNFGRVPGVNSSGSPVATASFEYETCYQCHSDFAKVTPRVPRKILQNNSRLEFSPSAVSFHPVQTQGRNMDVPSLKLPWTTSSLMYCSDCHASESSTSAGGGGPSGTHGSNFEGLLSSRYETSEFVSESASSYALCYRCHDRSSILEDRSFPLHKKHIVDERTSCAACHDSHGISSMQGNTTNNSNLINFATNFAQPLASNGRLEFKDNGTFRGECTLSCHGANHDATRYGE
jgi:predicted CXXCH cytochrome family protein